MIALPIAYATLENTFQDFVVVDYIGMKKMEVVTALTKLNAKDSAQVSK